MIDPRSVSNFILDTRKFLGAQTTSLELQKILYFCHARYLVTEQKPLVSGNFEAWQYGPVHPVIYKAFREFSGNPITKRASSTNAVTGVTKAVGRPEKAIQRHIVLVVSSLYDLNAMQLVQLTHARNGPWDVVWRQNDSKGAIISDRTIEEHYAQHRLPIGAVEEAHAEIIYEDIPPYYN